MIFSVLDLLNNVLKSDNNLYFYINEEKDVEVTKLNLTKDYENKVKLTLPKDIYKYILYRSQSLAHNKWMEKETQQKTQASKQFVNGTDISESGSKSKNSYMKKELLEAIGSSIAFLEKEYEHIKRVFDWTIKTRTYIKLHPDERSLGYYNSEDIDNSLNNINIDIERNRFLESIADSLNNYKINEKYCIDNIQKELGISCKANSKNIALLFTSAIIIAIYSSKFYENEKYLSLKETIKKNLITYVESELSNLSPKETIIKNDFLPFENYIPRQKEAELLLNYLSNGKKPISITGQGGLGKSEFIRHFAYENKKKYNFIFLHFNTNIKNTVADICLSNENDIKFEYINEERIARTIDEIYEFKMNVLRRQDENTVLIIDNFDAGDDTKNICKDKCYKELLELPVGVIFTTRAKLDGIDIYPVYMEEMSTEQLLDLMNSYDYVNNNISNETLKEIIALASSHTLTVDLIARLLNGNGLTRISASEMIEKLKIQDYDTKEVISNYNRDNYEGKIIEHLNKLFNLSSLSEEAKYVMSCVALLSNLGLNSELFLNAIGEEHERTIVQLSDSGWIKIIHNDIFVHSLIKAVCSNINDTAPSYKNCHGFIYKLMHIRSVENDIEKLFSEKIANQVIDILKCAVPPKTKLSNLKRSRMFYAIHREYNMVMGNLEKAYKYIEKARSELLYIMPTGAINIIKLDKERGLIASKRNRHDLAINILSRAYNSINELIDNNIEHKTELMLEKSSICTYLGHTFIMMCSVENTDYLKTSLKFYTEALDINKEIYGDINYNVAVSYINVGSVLSLISEDDMASNCLQTAIDYIENQPGSDSDINLSRAYTHLALTNSNANDFLSSISNLEKSYIIALKKFPENSFHHISLYERMYQMYFAIQDYKNAIKYMKLLIDIFIIREDKNLWKIFNLYDKIAYSYYKNSMCTDALEYWSKAENLLNEIDPDNGHKSLRIVMNKASMNRRLGNIDEAISLYNKALTFIDFSNNKPADMFLILCGKGLSFHKMGDIKLAEEMYDNAFALNVDIVDPVMGELCTIIGNKYINEKNKNKAMRFFKKGLDIYNQDPGANEVELASLSKTYIELSS